jgi:hypothetical protein
MSPGHPWNPLDFAPSQPNAGQQNPIGDITRLGSHFEMIAKARNLLSQLLPGAVDHSDVTVAELWEWFRQRNAFLFSDTQLAAATVANDPDLPHLERAKYDQLCQCIVTALGNVPRCPIQPLQMTQGGCLTITNSIVGWSAVAAVATGALLAVCSRMNMIGFVTNIRRGSVIIHFRLMITPDSTITTRQGYDQLETMQRDGSLELELEVGPVLFEIEDCVDDSPLMLLHQQRCNYEAVNRQLGKSLQLKPDYTSEELRILRMQMPAHRAMFRMSCALGAASALVVPRRCFMPVIPASVLQKHVMLGAILSQRSLARVALQDKRFLGSERLQLLCCGSPLSVLLLRLATVVDCRWRGVQHRYIVCTVKRYFSGVAHRLWPERR